MTVQEIIDGLYTTCLTCNGTGKSTEWCRTFDRACLTCEGSGKIVSWEGEQLLEFIAKNSVITFKK